MIRLFSCHTTAASAAAEGVKMQAAILCLLCLPPVVITATLRLEAESISNKHSVMLRSAASNASSVHVSTSTERLSSTFCLYRQVPDAIITVVYSNDGGQDTVAVKLNGARTLKFHTVAQSNFGRYWNVFRAVHFRNVQLNRGFNFVTLTFQSVDRYGVEIDYIGVTVDDEFITDDVFRCKLMIGEEPRMESRAVAPGSLVQLSYRTPCPEEDNVHLAVYHPNIQQYTITATNPLYQSMYDTKTNDDAKCPNLGYIYWRFENVDASKSSSGGNVWKPVAPTKNINNASMTAMTASSNRCSNINAIDYAVKYTVSFRLKGFKDGFIDADIWSDLRAKFCRTSSSSSSFSASSFTTPSVTVSYKNRHQEIVTMDPLKLIDDEEEQSWSLPENTWSDDRENYITFKVSEPGVRICYVELIRGYQGPERSVDIYRDDTVLLEGKRADFWWRRPLRENLTVTVGDKTVHNLIYLALYVSVPWTGHKSFNQILVLYQDGNLRLVPTPYAHPKPHYWLPFGTSVIVGRSNPADLRPAASIRHLTFYPDTLQMALTYYDGSSCKLTLTYSVTETSVKVTDLLFSPRLAAESSAGLPFATFRSMFVAFRDADSDSVQSDLRGPEHVLGAWKRINGTEFLVFRAVESHHLTQSPDVRLTIDA